MRKPPSYIQHDAMDCAPTCLRMIMAYYGKKYSLQQLRELTDISRAGVSLYNIIIGSQKLGFNTLSLKTTVSKLKDDCILPCLLHWNDNHYVVLYKIKNKNFYIADPAVGYLKYDKKELTNFWETHHNEGIILLLEPNESFYNSISNDQKEARTFKSLIKYFQEHRTLFYQLTIGLLVTTGIQIFFPYITQSIVDKGIGTKNIHFILLIAIGQFMLIAGRMVMDFIRSWLLLHISIRVNVSLLVDFLTKLMRLPVSFFDTKNVGDIFQRIGDHKRIEQVLTVTSLNAIFSLFTFIFFSIVLLTYNLDIFIVFLAASSLYFSWTLLFLKKRRELDYKKFNIYARNQNNLLQIIEGMQEIKLNNAEDKKRQDWESIQAKIFKLNTQTLFWSQSQQSGAFFINEIKNIIIVCLSAYSVIKGEITLGAMMAIQYIIGQLNSPINQFISIIQIIQDAKISMDRINEIHTFRNETKENHEYVTSFKNDDITFTNISFSYPGYKDKPVLNDINLVVEQSKTTAIVGTSGSGKTTILKLLLKFYEAQSGNIELGSIPFSNLAINEWRKKCGAVLQDGYIFSDTVAANIAPSETELNYDRLYYAIKVANLEDFIMNLPVGIETRIGAEGHGISQGQKQRILIARSVYKNPDYIFFDEATNALDANNESIIMQNLQQFFQEKTVIVVAHRLSTVKKADKIVVLENGRIVEEGTHAQLTNMKGKYFELVKNQLELSLN